MPLGVATAAACIAWPRRRTTCRPDSKSIAPANDQRGVFAQAQPGGPSHARDDVGLADLQALERRQAGDEDRRLADVGRLERLGGPFDAEAPQVDPQDLAGPVEQRPDRGQLLIELAAHPDELRTLAGEQKGDLGHRWFLPHDRPFAVTGATVVRPGFGGRDFARTRPESGGGAPAELLDDPVAPAGLRPWCRRRAGRS